MKEKIFLIIITLQQAYIIYFLLNFKKFEMPNNWKYMFLGVILYISIKFLAYYLYGFFTGFFNK